MRSCCREPAGFRRDTVKAGGIAYRSAPHGAIDMQVNIDRAGRIVYWTQPDGHVREALTVSCAR